MEYLAYTAVIVFLLYLSYGTLFYGTRNSLSRLGMDWNRWLFMLMMWAEALLVVPKMFDMTPENIQFIVFLIGTGLLFTGGASLSKSDDIKYHLAGAILASVCSVVWLVVISPAMLLIPLLFIASGTTNQWQWNGEIGLIIAILLTLIL